jgi:hypothetical protein
MTLIATRFPMRPTKRELGRSVMIEDRHFPVVFTVTALTLGAIAPAMLVVRAMAGNAIHREFLFRRPGFVARVARCRAVSTAQDEFRIARVIEANLLPAFVRMAARAVRPEAAEMQIVQTVTALAIHRDLLVPPARVAQIAAHITVSSGQRETGLRMIETRLGPGLFRMAVAALDSERARMRVILLVTIVASALRLPESGLHRVARLACRTRVPAEQREIRDSMIEGFVIEADDVALPTEMLGVATPTSRSRNPRPASVETGFGLDVSSDVLMAFDAKGLLLVDPKRNVALRTIALDVRMALDHRARHHELFHVDRPRCDGEGSSD